ncbi:thioesterase II family protein [Kitasatospora sp. NPDC051984]|uniref:thioesterase II family protein n=1 Tax=Kitasatospora sp. NPDC051984 TaxID=3364059 RepID=UPI0037C8CE77
MAPARTQVFCIPHAGGSAGVFRPWQRTFPAGIEVVPLEPAGRGTRRSEPFATELPYAAVDLAGVLVDRLDGDEFLVLGHCMGALIAYELVCHLERSGLKTPRTLIVSGRNPPHLQTDWGRRVAKLPDDELFAELSAVGGVPRGLSRAMAEGFLHIIRNDQRMVHAYTPADPPHRISVPVHVLAGREDGMTHTEQLPRWAAYTSGPVEVEYLPGGHYFLYDKPDRVAALIAGRSAAQQAVTA